MGIYPDTRWESVQSERWDERWKLDKSAQRGQLALKHHNDFSGLRVTYVYELVAIFEERTDCFCCSCGDHEGSDAACRNHGWAAQRPCEKHNMPGEAWDPELGIGEEMPKSVQEYRRERDGQ